MSIVADTYDYVIGVDTHAETHSYVILSTVNGAVVAGPKKFTTTQAGLARAIHWSTTTTGADPQQVLAAVEGSGSYGRRLALALTGENITVAEVRPPRRGGPKSDALDAEGAARVVLRTETTELAQPRAGELRQCLALELGARRAISKEVVADTQRVITLARRFDLGIDARRGLGKAKITAISHWRARSTDSPSVATARSEAIRLARKVIGNRRDLARNERRLHALAVEMAPSLLEEPGVGAITAAVLLVSYSHKGRFATEAKWATHAGCGPIPTGSGNSDGRYVRLNSGNDRQLNSAIYQITQARLRCYEPTRNYRNSHADPNKPLPGKVRRTLQRYVARDLYRVLEKLNIHPAVV